MNKKILNYSLIGLGIILAVAFLIYSVISETPNPKKFGVTAIGGVCNGSEATTQQCNVNDNYLTVQNNADVLGTLTVTGLSSFNGGVVSDGLYPSGDVTASSTSSNAAALTAANICNSSVINFTPLGDSCTVTAPATTTLFASCLTAVGQTKDITWNAIATSTVLAAGAGGTLGYSSSTTVAAGKYALIRFIRDTASTYKMYLVNIGN